MRRLSVVLAILGTIVPAVFWSANGAAAPAAEAPLRVVELRTEHKINPIGIDEIEPLLAWKLDGDGAQKPQGQQAYEIRVAPSPAALAGGGADVWDSGKVVSGSNSNIPLKGVPLQSRQAAAWQVRVWDEAGRVSDWSAPATFEMGLLAPSDWTARWIENAAYNYTWPNGAETPLPIFEKNFQVSGTVAHARLYMTGLGMYATALNGAAVSDHVLEPGQTTYAAEVSYRTYDLTEKLKRGDNVLRVETGSGAYQRVATPGRYFFGAALEQHVTYGEPKVIAQIEITYTDGRRQIVASDGSWRTAFGATTFSSWWSGEEYDARRVAIKDWRNASLANISATTTPNTSTPLRADPRPPVVVTETVAPVGIRPIGKGSYILDFGANRSGWPSVRVSGKAGTVITMTPSELLKPDGSLDVASTGAVEGKKIAYRYTLAGTGVETWSPKFTYNGFRYLQVDGLPTAPDKDTVTVAVMYAANPRASSFETSSPLLRDIHAITLRAMQSNMMSVLTDCPDREKGPYTGDNLHNLDALLIDYDMSAYEPQLVRNMTTAQRKPGDLAPGLIANITPEFHRVRPDKLNWPQGVIEFTDEVNWGGAVIRVPWRLYEVYGDTRTMARHYGNMVAWLDYEAANKAANKGDIPGLGDWSASDNTTPMMLAILAGYYTAADDMAKIAEVLGKKEDQAKYKALATNLAKEFNTRFRHVDKKKGVYYGSDSETSNAMALDAGLVAPGEVAQVRARLVDSVRRAGNHITSGSVGLGPLFRALQAAGRNDVLYDMVVNPTKPGYGFLIGAGYTTLPESLEGTGSQNHHFLGQVDAWFITALAGIRQAPGSIAYRQVEIAPAIVGDLTHASGSYAAPNGVIKSAWRKEANGLTLDVSIPSGTTANVRLAAADWKRVEATGAGEKPQLVQTTATETIYKVGAGSFTFRGMN